MHKNSLRSADNCFYTHRFNEVGSGVYWFHVVRLSVCTSICPSVCRQNRVRSVTSTILAGSVAHLHILLSNFRSCDFQICNFDFALFWLGIWYESVVWVIMGRRGYSQNAGVLVVLVLIAVTPDRNTFGTRSQMIFFIVAFNELITKRFYRHKPSPIVVKPGGESLARINWYLQSSLKHITE